MSKVFLQGTVQELGQCIESRITMLSYRRRHAGNTEEPPHPTDSQLSNHRKMMRLLPNTDFKSMQRMLAALTLHGQQPLPHASPAISTPPTIPTIYPLHQECRDATALLHSPREFRNRPITQPIFVT